MPQGLAVTGVAGGDGGVPLIGWSRPYVGPRMPKLQSCKCALLGSIPPKLGDSLAGAAHQLYQLIRLEIPDVEASNELIEALAKSLGLVSLELRKLVGRQGVSDFKDCLVSADPEIQSLTFHLPVSDLDPTSTLSFQPLSPLLCRRELRSLRILHPRVIALDFNDIRSLGEAWPHIKVLYLSGEITRKVLRGLTPATLKVFAESLGSTLEELG